MAGHERTDEAFEPDRLEEVILWIQVSPGARFAGFVGRSGPDLPHPFSGWLDFMGAVNALRGSGSDGSSKRT
jgi:hypothetical protein